MSDGPPGCNDKTGSPHCQPQPVYVDGKARFLDRARAGKSLVAPLFLASHVVAMWDDWGSHS